MATKTRRPTAGKVKAVKSQVNGKPPARPLRESMTVVVSTRLSKGDLAAIDKLAAKERTTHSNMVRLIVERHLEALRLAEKRKREKARRKRAEEAGAGDGS